MFENVAINARGNSGGEAMMSVFFNDKANYTSKTRHIWTKTRSFIKILEHLLNASNFPFLGNLLSNFGCK